MKVTVKPFSLQDHQICRIYKLELKLYKPEHYPKYADSLSEDWEETLRIFFVRELEDAIENHISLLNKIRGIKNFKADPVSKASDDMDKDISGNESQREEEGDDDGEHDEGTEDFGLDARKRKLQATDEMDYEDDSEEEVSERNQSAGSDVENDEGENDEIDNLGAKEETPDSEHCEAENEAEFGKVAEEERPESEYEAGNLSELSQKETKSTGEKKRNEKELMKKKNDRAIYVEAEGFHFEVHFRFTNEPHILLAQVLLCSSSLLKHSCC